jgi:hypothetical protein
MALKRCRRCGLPKRLSDGYIWPGNGVILARHDPTMRMIVFEADYYPYIWSALEERLGVNIPEAMIKGQRASTQDYLENHFMYGWRRFAYRHLPVPVVFKRTIGELALFGFAGMELLEYRKGKLIAIRVRHPFDIISIAWGLKGMGEFVEGMGSELAWKKEGDDYLLSILYKPGERSGEGVDLETLRLIRESKRELSFAGKLLPPGGDTGEPCPSCGLPKALTELEWREDEGIIRHRDSGRRYIFTTGHVFLGVMRDLGKRTGRDLEPLIMQLTKDYHLRTLQGIPVRTRHGAYRAAARYLLAGGYGKVQDYKYGEGYLEMTIGNPFYIPRLVGRMAGLFEYVEEQEAAVSYRVVEPRVLRLEIRAT